MRIIRELFAHIFFILEIIFTLIILLIFDNLVFTIMTFGGFLMSLIIVCKLNYSMEKKLNILKMISALFTGLIMMVEVYFLFDMGTYIFDYEVIPIIIIGLLYLFIQFLFDDFDKYYDNEVTKWNKLGVIRSLRFVSKHHYHILEQALNYMDFD